MPPKLPGFHRSTEGWCHLPSDGVIYQEEDYLQLSGLQHFVFCRRQWALIHIEQLWEENYHTVDGSLLHKKAHDGTTESRGNLLITRSISIRSPHLGISGKCDVVEFSRSPEGVALPGHSGTWQVCPVEYKRGKPKEDLCDALQLCAQGMCLEEMLCCDIPEGYLYYWQERRRMPVLFTQELREQVKQTLREMHALYRRGYTPKVKPGKHCSACSLKALCLPKLSSTVSAQLYLRKSMEAIQ